MNKAEFIDAIAEQTGKNKKEINLIVSAALDIITDTVAEGEKVVFVGFGAFEPRDRQAREGHNPRTGEKMEIPATRFPAFSAGKQFKEKVAA
jgi:DNA-binding protein HU-beta